MFGQSGTQSSITRKVMGGNSSVIVPLKWIEHGVYGDLIIIYPRPYSMYFKGIVGFRLEIKVFPNFASARVPSF